MLDQGQFGFQCGRSVEDQLLLTYETVPTWLDEGYMVDIIFFNFSKAFDVVNHFLLLTKLRALGISETILTWIKHFLCGRKMQVLVSGSSSKPRDVLSGVPQGSVLGPVLFLIYVNLMIFSLN